MDSSEKAVRSNIKLIRPDIQITNSRNTDLLNHFAQMLSEDTAFGVNVDSVQFMFIGKKTDKGEESTYYMSHYWIDPQREPDKEFSYIVQLLEAEIQKRIYASQNEET